MNQFSIGKPCINIASSGVLFKQCIMDINRDKYDIEVRNYYAIKHNRIFFYFMQRTFNRLDGLYLHKKILLIDTIKEYQSKNQSAAEIEKLNREKKSRNKRKEGTSKPSTKKKTVL